MIRYEIKERCPIWGPDWITRKSFDSMSEAREYWSTAVFDGVEAKLVKVVSIETIEHYHPLISEAEFRRDCMEDR